MKSVKSFSSYAVTKGNSDSFLYTYIDLSFVFPTDLIWLIYYIVTQ
jgi:hypothetical protein